MTEVRHHTANDGLDQFIPVRRSEMLSALAKQGAFANDDEREKFRFLVETLKSICHYEYFGLLERLRHDYYYFSPEIAPHVAQDSEVIDCAYADLLRSVDEVLKGANFNELPCTEVDDAHRRRTVLKVEITAPLDDFRDVRFYRRGRHVEQFEVADWFGLRRRAVEAEVYDDVVMLVAMKSHAEIGSRRKLRILERRKIVPGSVLLKYFRNIASSDLHALFPNARVVMSNTDKIALGVPAIAASIPILLNLYATITVLFLVVGFYLGMRGAVEDKDMKTAFAAVTALVALGGFAVGQWVRYQRQSLKHQIELTDNVYFRNINNNAGIFDYMIGAAENQACKEAILAYHFIRTASSPPTAEELDGRVEAWLRDTFGIDLDFKVDKALATLERLGLLQRQGQRLAVLPLAGARAQLHRVWEAFLPTQIPAAAQ
jgi:hypothetical protein